MFKIIKNIFLKIIFVMVLIYLLIFVPELFGRYPLVVKSGSMEPLYKVGSIIYYEKTLHVNISENEILVYKTNKDIISHRVVEKTNNGFVTKGDANKSKDSSIVNYKQILGRGYEYSIEYLGYYADFIYNHKIILYFAIILLFIDYIVDIAFNRRQ